MPAVDLVAVAFCDLDVMVVAEADFVFVVAINRNYYNFCFRNF